MVLPGQQGACNGPSRSTANWLFLVPAMLTWSKYGATLHSGCRTLALKPQADLSIDRRATTIQQSAAPRLITQAFSVLPCRL